MPSQYAGSSGELLAEVSELKARMYILGEKLHAQKWLFGADSSEVLVLYSRYLERDQRAAAVYDRKRRKAYIMMIMLHRSSSSNFLLKLRQLLGCDSILSARTLHRSGSPVCHNHC
jgi:hypothetical protein